jgi:hypothetical protein
MYFTFKLLAVVFFRRKDSQSCGRRQNKIGFVCRDGTTKEWLAKDDIVC